MSIAEWIGVGMLAGLLFHLWRLGRHWSKVPHTRKPIRKRHEPLFAWDWRWDWLWWD